MQPNATSNFKLSGPRQKPLVAHERPHSRLGMVRCAAVGLAVLALAGTGGALRAEDAPAEGAGELPEAAASILDDLRLEGKRQVTTGGNLLDLFTGYYAFDDGAEGAVNELRRGDPIARHKEMLYQAAFFEDADEERGSVTFGFWASLPFERRTGESGAASNLIGELQGLGDSRTRMRTSRAPEGEAPSEAPALLRPVSRDSAERGGRPGLFSRIFGAATSAPEGDAATDGEAATEGEEEALEPFFRRGEGRLQRFFRGER